MHTRGDASHALDNGHCTPCFLTKQGRTYSCCAEKNVAQPVATVDTAVAGATYILEHELITILGAHYDSGIIHWSFETMCVRCSACYRLCCALDIDSEGAKIVMIDFTVDVHCNIRMVW